MKSNTVVWLVIGVLLATAAVVVWDRAESLGTFGADPGDTPIPEPSNSAQPNPIAADDADPLFTEITDDVGLDFVHEAGRAGTYFLPQVMVTGAAFLDFDRDGDFDIYLVNGNKNHTLEPGEQPPNGPTTNRLYRHEPDGRFVDVSTGSGLDDPEFGMGAAIGDVNNDGYPDVYLTNLGPDRLFLNQQDGTFVDVTEAAGIDNAHFSASACFFDYDRDGWLDLYVTNYLDVFAGRKCLNSTRQQVFCGPRVFHGLADKLYHNLGARLADHDRNEKSTIRFEDVSVSSGIAKKAYRGLGVVALDFNDDGWQDLYVANDTDANFLWINNQDGTFRDDAVPMGAAFDLHGAAQGSMGIAHGDLNGDSAYDLFTTNSFKQNNALYLSDGHLGFTESSSLARLAVPSLPWTGFGTVLADVDHDSDLDLLVVNGNVQLTSTGPLPQDAAARAKWAESPALFWQDYGERNQLFLNDGDGRFTEFKSLRDPFTAPLEVSRALCAGDVDDDGDLDFLITNVAGPARLYRNDAPKAGHWLMVNAVLPDRGGRHAYGATITVVAGEKRWRQTVSPGSSYLSSHDPRVHFGLGATTQFDRLEVRWPDGTDETFPGGAVDRHLEVQKGPSTTGGAPR